MEELEKRLRGRGTEKEEQIQTRLGNAAKELEYGYVVVQTNTGVQSRMICPGAVVLNALMSSLLLVFVNGQTSSGKF